MSKRTILWGFPLAGFLVLAGILSIYTESFWFDPKIYENEPLQRAFYIIYGIVFILAGLYGLCFMFIQDYDFYGAGERFTVKETLVSYLWVCGPALFLCYTGYMAFQKSISDLQVIQPIDQIDVLSYLQLAFAIFCGIMFFTSYPKKKKKNVLMLFAAILTLLSGFLPLSEIMFMLGALVEENYIIIPIIAKIIYFIGIGLFVYSIYLEAKENPNY